MIHRTVHKSDEFVHQFIHKYDVWSKLDFWIELFWEECLEKHKQRREIAKEVKNANKNRQKRN